MSSHAHHLPALWDGFLAQEPVRPAALARFERLQGARVLITGAGGYLGSAAARALAAQGVAHLCLLDVVEHGLYDLQQHLDARHPGVPYDLALGSITDEALLQELFARHRPTLVLHTAALKHVPLLETNALAAAAINVLGTATLLRAVAEAEIPRVVVCSTDKAVQPVSVMGATKRLAEQLAFNAQPQARVLRLCNVLGSTGSVAPLFAAQIAQGMPLTVTDRDVERLWLTLTEATHCMLASLCEDLPTPLAVPREAEPRRVLDLLAHMLQRANVSTPQIAFTGLRRGERLQEQLHNEQEITAETGSGPLQALVVRLPEPGAVWTTLRAVEDAVRTRNRDALHRLLGLGEAQR